MDNHHALLEVSALALFFQLQDEKELNLLELDLKNRTFKTADVQSMSPLTKEYVQLANGNGATTQFLLEVCNNLSQKQVRRLFVLTSETCILLEVQQTDKLLPAASITF